MKSSWKYGSIDVRPVLNGSIRYVLKYLQKSVNGSYADLNYFDFGIEKPFVLFSKGFGSGLYYEQAENIRKYNCMKFGRKRLPVPLYWKNKFIKLCKSFQSKILEDNNKKLLNDWASRGSPYGSFSAYSRNKSQSLEDINRIKSLNSRGEVVLPLSQSNINLSDIDEDF